ncbi:MAG: phosphatase PAP2 family protein [Dysgonamonadaceae bacterium]|jgi:undecaprenyl-diphosphatase|nr:phosphatase PAP2 family protein [Dysgonamonadaceae bacterium]
MLEQLLPYERPLFFLMNGSDSALMDNFMWLYSYKFTWLPLYLCLFFLFIYKYRSKQKEYILIFVSIFFVILICDQVASGIIKPLFHRFRPTHHPDFLEQVNIVFGYRGGKYGFASSHASNAFGLATFTALLFRNRLFSMTMFTFAAITAYSRIYLGVHFISDVVVGALIGLVSGFLIYKVYIFTRKNLIIREKNEPLIPIYNIREAVFVCGTWFSIVILTLIFNSQLVKLTL